MFSSRGRRSCLRVREMAKIALCFSERNSFDKGNAAALINAAVFSSPNLLRSRAGLLGADFALGCAGGLKSDYRNPKPARRLLSRDSDLDLNDSLKSAAPGFLSPGEASRRR